MPKFRKRPVIIEAEQLTVENKNRAYNFITCNHVADGDAEHPSIRIQTLEGEMTADVGDWIIRGVKGEFYPCKKDIFGATYEAVETAVSPGENELRTPLHIEVAEGRYHLWDADNKFVAKFHDRQRMECLRTAVNAHAGLVAIADAARKALSALESAANTNDEDEAESAIIAKEILSSAVVANDSMKER